MTPRQREAQASEHLREVLNLLPTKGDTVAFATALAEIAAEESKHNSAFANAIRDRYRDLLAKPPKAVKATTQGSSSTRSRAKELPPLVPIRRIEGYRADPFSPPDPQFLIQLYGYNQLARALQDYTLPMLKEAALKIQREHPGTKPTSFGRNDAVIKYIVNHSGGNQ